MREIQQLNTRCLNNTYSVVLSPDASQKRFTYAELLEMTREHLKNLGLENHQYIACVHNSTKNQHVHIIVNRIFFDGKAHSDKYISKRAQRSAEELAKSRGLFTANDILQKKKIQTSDIRKNIANHYNSIASKSSNIEQFMNRMYDKGFRIDLTKNKQGNIQGFRIYARIENISFKASDIGKNIRYPKLIEQLEKNKKILEQQQAEYKEFRRIEALKKVLEEDKPTKEKTQNIIDKKRSVEIIYEDKRIFNEQNIKSTQTQKQPKQKKKQDIDEKQHEQITGINKPKKIKIKR